MGQENKDGHLEIVRVFRSAKPLIEMMLLLYISKTSCCLLRFALRWML